MVALPLAGVAFKRPVRLLPLLALSLALTAFIAHLDGFRHASSLSSQLFNPWAQPPRPLKSFVEYLNVLFAFFFADPWSFGYYDVPFSVIPPAGAMWVVPVLFQQTYTLVTVAYLIPFGTLRAKLVTWTGLTFVCYWVGSWAWYSLTGLALAEFAVVYVPRLSASGYTGMAFDLNFLWALPRSVGLLKQGKRLRCKGHFALWVPGAAMAIVGLALKYLCAWVPAARMGEYWAHTDITTGNLLHPQPGSSSGSGTSAGFDPYATPYPRIDDWLVATGMLCAIEVAPRFQDLLANRVLVHLGRLGFGKSADPDAT